MQTLTTDEEVSKFIEQSSDEPVIIFKHSTTCPISAAAHKEVVAFESTSDAPIGIIRVIENRPVSLNLAQTLGVEHQSPQTIIVQNGKAVWDTSHYDISVRSLTKALANQTAGADR